MSKLVRAVPVLSVALALIAPLVLPISLSAQGRARQDSLRQGRLTAEELHRQRRDALAAERAGLVPTEPARYGAAVVGAPGVVGLDGRAGMSGLGGMVQPGAGEVAVVCTGVMRAQPGDRMGAGLVPGTFRGECRPADGSGWGEGRGPGEYPGQAVPGWDPGSYGAGSGRGSGDTGDGHFGNLGGGYGNAGGAHGSPGSNYGGAYGGGYGALGTGWGGAWGGGYGGFPGPYANGFGSYAPGLAWGGGEYYMGPFGLVPARPFGWSAGPGGAYAFSWPGFSMGECVRVQVTGPGEVRTEILVGLQALGLADAADLDLSIDARLTRGERVDLIGLDGRVLRLVPGVPYDAIRVLPCSNDRR